MQIATKSNNREVKTDDPKSDSKREAQNEESKMS
jgi:hypothetical protein